jgi:hypothetical protein
MVVSLEGPGTKNDCAGEGQQQFTRDTVEKGGRPLRPTKALKKMS